MLFIKAIHLMAQTSLVPALADQATPEALCQIGTPAPDAQLMDHDGALAIAPYEYATAQRFLRGYQLPFPVLADESRASYHRFGLTEGTFRDSFGLDVLVQQVKQAPRGNMAYVVPGHPVQQLGGSFIVDRSGIVRLAHIARPIYMYPAIADYLAVFQEVQQNMPASPQ